MRRRRCQRALRGVTRRCDHAPAPIGLLGRNAQPSGGVGRGFLGRADEGQRHRLREGHALGREPVRRAERAGRGGGDRLDAHRRIGGQRARRHADRQPPIGRRQGAAGRTDRRAGRQPFGDAGLGLRDRCRCRCRRRCGCGCRCRCRCRCRCGCRGGAGGGAPAEGGVSTSPPPHPAISAAAPNSHDNAVKRCRFIVAFIITPGSVARSCDRGSGFRREPLRRRYVSALHGEIGRSPILGLAHETEDPALR